MENKRLSKRFLLLDSCPKKLSEPRRYERYYLNNQTRVQKKGQKYEKEELSINNIVLTKIEISEEEFLNLIKNCSKKIIRDSYLLLDCPNISIKVYKETYEGLSRIEVDFKSKEEMDAYQKEYWMGPEITDTPLAFDARLIELSQEKFQEILKQFKEKHEDQ